MAKNNEQALAILAELVAFNSVSRNSNLPIIDYIENKLAPLGIACTRVPSPDGNKANLIARIGPDAPGGMVWSGHTDVVPVDGQAWDTDPFTLTRKDDTLFGRGTSDMKSFIALALAHVDAAQAAALQGRHCAISSCRAG